MSENLMNQLFRKFIIFDQTWKIKKQLISAVNHFYK